MSEHQGGHEKPAPGFCSATCVDKASLEREIQKPEPKTSDFFVTCNLPKRFEYPHIGELDCTHAAPSGAWSPLKKLSAPTAIGSTCNERGPIDWFNGYGSQVSKQHPFYRTSASEYGWYAPGIHSVPSVFFPAGQTFTNRLSAAGMYRNYSLNTGMDPPSYK